MNEEFLNRVASTWQVSQGKAVSLLLTKYQQSVRLNPFKYKKSTIQSIKNIAQIEPINWAKDCYYILEQKKPLSLLPEFASGEFILQNASSFVPVVELDLKPDDKILDMAAAPGGKSGHIASLTNNKAKQLVLNDTSRIRYFKMQKLMQAQGVNADYSLRDGRYLSKIYGQEYFDKILLDAPCSGEANLTNTDKWNLKTIKRLSKLQKSLLSEAFKLLKPGGTLVYSTCTISPEENEVVIDYLIRHQLHANIATINNFYTDSFKPVINWEGADLSWDINNTLRIKPSQNHKPFFIAKLTKTVSSAGDDSYNRLKKAYETTQ